MVFQSYALYPHMTVHDNLAFGLKLRKVPKAEIEKRDQRGGRDPPAGEACSTASRKELSGGQRQRVALGRAIVREPAVFLMDEPLSNLDAKLRVQTRAEIARLHQRLGTTTVYVTHDQVEAMTMGQRIAVMSDGPAPAGRHAAGAVRPPAQPVRRRLHRQPVDELRRACPSATAAARAVRVTASTLPDARAQHRAAVAASGDEGRRGLPPGAPRARRGRGRRSATIQGTADVVEYLGNEELLHVSVGGPRHRRDRRLVASRPAGRRRDAQAAAREAPPVRDRRGG